LSYIPHGQYLDFPDLVIKLLETKEKVVGYCCNDYWQDLGNPEDYESAARDFDEMPSKFLKDYR
jgi:NDP-sugar pyrophosphorylase family protein